MTLRNNNVQGREDGDSSRRGRLLHIRTSTAEPEQAGNRQDVEQQYSKDNIIEQIAVLPGEGEQDGPAALYPEGEIRRVSFRIELACAAEEQVILRHCVVDSARRIESGRSRSRKWRS